MPADYFYKLKVDFTLSWSDCLGREAGWKLNHLTKQTSECNSLPYVTHHHQMRHKSHTQSKWQKKEK